MDINKGNSKLYYTMLTFLVALIGSTIIALNTVSFAAGVQITFKVYFTLFLGILYGILSIRCFYVYPKHLYFEQNKAQLLEQPETNNIEASKRESQRREFVFAHAKYSAEYNQLSQLLYLLQGVMALAICIEFLCDYLICKAF